MTLAAAVGVLGALGAVLRYLVDGAVQDRTSGAMPYGTLTVNVAGSLILGVVAGVATAHADAATARTLIGTGLCGGLTTWSTASWESVRLVEEDLRGTALTFTLLNLVASLAAGGIGLVIGQA